jgi:ATP phosphoribosyltransferase regulatory subunit
MSSEPFHPALLPEGLRDVLPPDAGHEAALVERLINGFAGWGYQRVKPPLIEFEETLLAGAGAAVAQQTFRLMDPVSHRMMAVRPDMTLQVARIATSRLARAPRPLRLAYGGQVLRVRGSQLRPARQFGQVGVELIGALEPEADAEVIVMAAEALQALGVSGLSVDLCVPTLVPSLCRAWALPLTVEQDLRAALDRKDAAAVAAVGGVPAEILGRLMAGSGLAGPALAVLAAVELPAAAEADRRRLNTVAALVRAAVPEVMLTVDLVEHRQFEYQTGLSFTLFSRDVQGELGRGGRYRVAADAAAGREGEPATGLTLYTDTVVQAAPAPAVRARVYLPQGTEPELAAGLRAAGWATVAALGAEEDVEAEARRLECDHVLVGPEPRRLGRG